MQEQNRLHKTGYKALLSAAKAMPGFTELQMLLEVFAVLQTSVDLDVSPDLQTRTYICLQLQKFRNL